MKSKMEMPIATVILSNKNAINCESSLKTKPMWQEKEKERKEGTSKNGTTATTLIDRVISEFGKKILTLRATHQSHLVGRVRHEETFVEGKRKGLVSKHHQQEQRRRNVEAHEKRNEMRRKKLKKEEDVCFSLKWMLGFLETTTATLEREGSKVVMSLNNNAFIHKVKAIHMLRERERERRQRLFSRFLFCSCCFFFWVFLVFF